MSTSHRIDRRTVLKFGTTGAVMLGAGAPLASAQEKPKRGGTLKYHPIHGIYKLMDA